MTEEPTALRAVVRGSVQGVGFRFFVQDIAQKLGLTGYARNLPDGSVEVVAEGSSSALDTLLPSLRRGPSLSRVDRVDVAWAAPTGEYADFGIR